MNAIAFHLCLLPFKSTFAALFENSYMSAHLSEQEKIRREKLAELIMMGIEPYPAPLYPVNNHAANIKKN